MYHIERNMAQWRKGNGETRRVHSDHLADLVEMEASSDDLAEVVQGSACVDQGPMV